METQEQIPVIGEFPLAAWDDVPMRENLWAHMRIKAARTAAREDKVLTDTPETRSGAMYIRRVTKADGELADVECAREQAEFVRLRLSCWAEVLEGLLPDFTGEELTALVHGYPDGKLAELYRSATGGEWRRMLSDEIGRRDALGPAAGQP